ncbi:fatty acid amide hydrolase [Senna tora]|uniref:Fatty acid amide hydrolase n=1 Tax=Senna tora TaxID=362788 RepID=A0A834WY75_9FABA|nr:fatty acid amide hydrolase [Senna tora]
MVRSRKHDQGYTVKPAKAVATRDGILRVAPLKLVTREDDEAKEIVQMFRMGSLKVQHERLYEVHPTASLCQSPRHLVEQEFSMYRKKVLWLHYSKKSNIYFGWNFMAIKDDIDCYPHPSKGATTWMHEICTVKKDAVSVSRLRNCGVIFIGKANLHGLGMGTTGNNPNYIMASKHTTSVILMLDKVKKYK